MPLSYKPEVIADNTGKWCGNAVRFGSKAEAEEYVRDLQYRWTAVRETRVVESDEEINYVWLNGHAEPVPPAAPEAEPRVD